MPDGLSWHDFKRKFEKFGVTLTPQKKKPTHIKMTKKVAEGTIIYIAVRHDNKVEQCYVSKARKKFRLTPLHNVTDEDFDAA
jgi:hypothetical protein